VLMQHDSLLIVVDQLINTKTKTAVTNNVVCITGEPGDELLMALIL